MLGTSTQVAGDVAWSQQPVQLPGPQRAPPVQTPLEQVCEVAVQSLHMPPSLPQKVSEVPASQLPLALLQPEHNALVHSFAWHLKPDGQMTQETPALPHAELKEPGLHSPDGEQQPVGQFVGLQLLPPSGLPPSPPLPPPPLRQDPSTQL